MLGALLTFFRYLLLLLLYIFIFQLARMMLKGFKEAVPATGSVAEPVAAVKSGKGAGLPEVVPPPGAEAGLFVLASPDPGLTAGMVFPVEGQMVLGRGNQNNVVISDPFASVEHALVAKKQGQFWLEDLGSRNGTFLNEVRVTGPTVLVDQDRIRIGGVTLQFVRWAYEVESGQ